MKLQHSQTVDGREHIYTFSFTTAEYIEAKLDRSDKLLVCEVAEANDASIADYLFALELIARRIEENQAQRA